MSPPTRESSCTSAVSASTSVKRARSLEKLNVRASFRILYTNRSEQLGLVRPLRPLGWSFGRGRRRKEPGPGPERELRESLNAACENFYSKIFDDDFRVRHSSDFTDRSLVLSDSTCFQLY